MRIFKSASDKYLWEQITPEQLVDLCRQRSSHLWFVTPSLVNSHALFLLAAEFDKEPFVRSDALELRIEFDKEVCLPPCTTELPVSDQMSIEDWLEYLESSGGGNEP